MLGKVLSKITPTSVAMASEEVRWQNSLEKWLLEMIRQKDQEIAGLKELEDECKSKIKALEEKKSRLKARRKQLEAENKRLKDKLADVKKAGASSGAKEFFHDLGKAFCKAVPQVLVCVASIICKSIFGRKFGWGRKQAMA